MARKMVEKVGVEDGIGDFEEVPAVIAKVCKCFNFWWVPMRSDYVHGPAHLDQNSIDHGPQTLTSRRQPERSSVDVRAVVISFLYQCQILLPEC